MVHQVADLASLGGDRTPVDRDATRVGVIITPFWQTPETSARPDQKLSSCNAYIHVAGDRQPSPIARTAQAASDGRNLVRWHRPSTGIFPGLWPPRAPKFPSPKGC